MANETNTAPQKGAQMRSWAQVAVIPLRQPVVSKRESLPADESVLLSSLTLSEATSKASSTKSSSNEVQIDEQSCKSSVSSSPVAKVYAPPAEIYEQDKLQYAFQNLEFVKSLKGREDVTFIAIDIENFVYPLAATGEKPILEVGVTVWDGGSSANQKLKNETYHYIINEYRSMHNKKIKGGIYNHKNDFLGKSKGISIRKIGAELKYWIEYYGRSGEVVIVLHGGKSDVVDLAKMGCDIGHLHILDTQLIDRALYWKAYGQWQQRGLENLLRAYRYTPSPHIPFHNSGNDAFYTMTVFARMKAKIDAADEKEDMDDS